MHHLASTNTFQRIERVLQRVIEANRLSADPLSNAGVWAVVGEEVQVFGRWASRYKGA